MASDTQIAGGVAPGAFQEKKHDDIEPAPMTYTPEDESEQKDASESINYHTLTWWYVYPQT